MNGATRPAITRRLMAVRLIAVGQGSAACKACLADDIYSTFRGYLADPDRNQYTNVLIAGEWCTP